MQTQCINFLNFLGSKKANVPGYSAQALPKCYCKDGPADYKDPILCKGCNCDELATHYDSKYSRCAETDEKDYPKSEAPTDTTSLYQGSNDGKGATSEKHLDTQDSVIEPQDSRIEPQYTSIEQTQESTTEPQESTTESQDSTIEPQESTTVPQESTTEYQETTELQPILKEEPILMNKNYDNIIDQIVKAVLKKLELKNAQWHEAIEKSQESTTELQESTIEPQESTTELQESTTEPQESKILPQVSRTEPQDPKEFQPVLIEGPVKPIPQILADQLMLPGGQITVLMNVDRIVKAVLKQLKVKHLAIEEPKESTTEPPKPTAEPRESITEPQDQTNLPPYLKEGLILMNKNYAKNVDSIVKVVLKKFELKYTAIEEPKESTTEPQESTTELQESTTESQNQAELQPVLTEGPVLMNKYYDKNIDRIVKTVLEKLELKNISMEELQELTTEPQETTTEPQESITEPKDPTELLLASTAEPIANNKNKNNIIDRIVKAVLKTVEWKHVSIEELQESTTDPKDPTQLQPAVAAVLKKLELNNSGV